MRERIHLAAPLALAQRAQDLVPHDPVAALIELARKNPKRTIGIIGTLLGTTWNFIVQPLLDGLIAILDPEHDLKALEKWLKAFYKSSDITTMRLLMYDGQPIIKENIFIPINLMEAATEKPMKVGDLFHHSKKAIISCDAGCGKTTWSEHAILQWTKGLLWKDKFKIIFYISLKDLINIYTDTNFPKPKKITELDVLYNLYTKLEDIVSKDQLKKILAEHRGKILYIYDGYEEINNPRALTEAAAVTTLLAKTLFKQGYVLVSTRPAAQRELFTLMKQDDAEVIQTIKLSNLNSEQQKRYIRNFFSATMPHSTKTRELSEQFLATYPSDTYDMLQTPLNLELACSTWQKRHQEHQSFDFIISWPVIYDYFIIEYIKRFLHKTSDTNFPSYASRNSILNFQITTQPYNVKQLIDAIKYLAFQNQLGFHIGDSMLAEFMKKQDIRSGHYFSDAVFIDLGFISGKNISYLAHTYYKFIHELLKYHFAAWYKADRMIDLFKNSGDKNEELMKFYPQKIESTNEESSSRKNIDLATDMARVIAILYIEHEFTILEKLLNELIPSLTESTIIPAIFYVSDIAALIDADLPKLNIDSIKNLSKKNQLIWEYVLKEIDFYLINGSLRIQGSILRKSFFDSIKRSNYFMKKIEKHFKNKQLFDKPNEQQIQRLYELSKELNFKPEWYILNLFTLLNQEKFLIPTQSLLLALNPNKNFFIDNRYNYNTKTNRLLAKIAISLDYVVDDELIETLINDIKNPRLFLQAIKIIGIIGVKNKNKTADFLIQQIKDNDTFVNFISALLDLNYFEPSNPIKYFRNFLDITAELLRITDLNKELVKSKTGNYLAFNLIPKELLEKFLLANSRKILNEVIAGLKIIPEKPGVEEIELTKEILILFENIHDNEVFNAISPLIHNLQTDVRKPAIHYIVSFIPNKMSLPTKELEKFLLTTTDILIKQLLNEREVTLQHAIIQWLTSPPSGIDSTQIIEKLIDNYSSTTSKIIIAPMMEILNANSYTAGLKNILIILDKPKIDLADRRKLLMIFFHKNIESSDFTMVCSRLNNAINQGIINQECANKLSALMASTPYKYISGCAKLLIKNGRNPLNYRRKFLEGSLLNLLSMVERKNLLESITQEFLQLTDFNSITKINVLTLAQILVNPSIYPDLKLTSMQLLEKLCLQDTSQFKSTVAEIISKEDAQIDLAGINIVSEYFNSFSYKWNRLKFYPYLKQYHSASIQSNKGAFLAENSAASNKNSWFSFDMTKTLLTEASWQADKPTALPAETETVPESCHAPQADTYTFSPALEPRLLSPIAGFDKSHPSYLADSSQPDEDGPSSITTATPFAPPSLHGNILLSQVVWHWLTSTRKWLENPTAGETNQAASPSTPKISGNTLQIRWRELNRLLVKLQRQLAKLPLAEQRALAGLKFAITEHRDQLQEIQSQGRATTEQLTELAEAIYATQEELNAETSHLRTATATNPVHANASFFTGFLPSLVVDHGEGIGQNAAQSQHIAEPRFAIMPD